MLDSTYFTGQFMVDVNYIGDFNQPRDHTLVGSTSAGRTGELQVQHVGIGGDFHYQHARARVMTQFGLYSTMTPRNDSSTARGGFDLAGADRTLSEANAGYHWDRLNGINLDVGIFMSYVGLFSFYNNENWVYQASYTSANTPWFFDGMRLQLFLTDRLKTELWLVNGWQSYGTYDESPGTGFQILYRPNEDESLVSNGYWGYDTLNSDGRIRVHSDSSWTHRYYENQSTALSKGAFFAAFDLGCESGGGVKCVGGDSAAGGEPSQYFLSAMAYNRFWFSRDTLALTVGGGFMSNPGRYLVLLPPTQTPLRSGPTAGASATNNPGCAGCFTENKGDHFNGWDCSITFDYMPDRFYTLRAELNHRAADVPYFAGSGGVTGPTGTNASVAPIGWQPDLVKTEDRLNLALMARF